VKIIVGLGNPGRQYARTRHNVGFMVVDKLAANHGLTFSRRKFNAKVASGKVARADVILVKPQTFMNLSGDAVGPLVRFYQLPSSALLTVFDDIDIPFGSIRLRPSGSSGGHKGMKSIIATLGTDKFPRLRVGIRGSTATGDLSEYVLKPFTSEERTHLDDIVQRACECVETVLTGPFDKAMSQFN